MKKCLLGAIIFLALLLPASALSGYRGTNGDVPHGTATSTPPASSSTASVQYALETPLPASTTLSTSQETLKSLVYDEFKDVPAMFAVIACESHYRQFSASGAPLWSRTGDVGVMQIHAANWGPEAKRLGLDIYGSAKDNIRMGRIIYDEQGITAWTCAK